MEGPSSLCRSLILVQADMAFVLSAAELMFRFSHKMGKVKSSEMACILYPSYLYLDSIKCENVLEQYSKSLHLVVCCSHVPPVEKYSESLIVVW